jgi:hypothetical protein
MKEGRKKGKGLQANHSNIDRNKVRFPISSGWVHLYTDVLYLVGQKPTSPTYQLIYLVTIVTTVIIISRVHPINNYKPGYNWPLTRSLSRYLINTTILFRHVPHQVSTKELVQMNSSRSNEPSCLSRCI